MRSLLSSHHKTIGTVRQWDAQDEEYKVIKNAPHEYMCYKFIQDNNIRNAKVVAFWW